MKDNNNQVEVNSMLPEECFVVNDSTNEVVLVKRGEIGFYGTRENNLPWYGQEIADSLNADRGVSKAQAEAMKNGSIFGFDSLSANPALYE